MRQPDEEIQDEGQPAENQNRSDKSIFEQDLQEEVVLKRKVLVERIGRYFGNTISELPMPFPTSQATGELSCSI